MIQKGIYLVPTLYHYQMDREHDMRRYAGHSVAEVSERNFPKAVVAGVKIAFGSRPRNWRASENSENGS